ncbi:hypothetical protein QYE76_064667 [Lolium multiflorum]|uniref:Retrotransposon protein, putative, Ty1-copia subclass n=1 Tax=Lolium multiflorum TaxID=4521 RepID=A0AAD8WAF7_LOLMU|nr:hypothetical protein QYE76_064667 [Lolium multiflorum]
MVQKCPQVQGKEQGSLPDITNFKKKGKTEKKDPGWVVARRAIGLIAVHNAKERDVKLSVSMVIGNTGEGTTGFLVVKSGVDDMNVGTIFESRDATFFEDIFPMRDMHGMSSWESDPIHETPMESDEESDDESSDSDEDDNEAPTRSKRQRIAKSFAYATRPDISFAVCKLSRFVANPVDDHWHALERVMRYLKGTMSYGIHYTVYPRGLEGYSDSNWISDAKMKATSGYVFTLGGGAVSWKSCKQTILTRSTMEAELTALDTATVEAEWLRELLMDLPMVEKPIPAILMNCDNQTVIIKVKSSKDNMKSSKHIKRRLKSKTEELRSDSIGLCPKC